MSATELPIAPSPAPTISRARYAELARRVRLLSWASLAIISVEGAVAIASGLVASSIALVGFGLDSVTPKPRARASPSARFHFETGRPLARRLGYPLDRPAVAQACNVLGSYNWTRRCAARRAA